MSIELHHHHDEQERGPLGRPKPLIHVCDGQGVVFEVSGADFGPPQKPIFGKDWRMRLAALGAYDATARALSAFADHMWEGLLTSPSEGLIKMGYDDDSGMFAVVIHTREAAARLQRLVDTDMLTAVDGPPKEAPTEEQLRLQARQKQVCLALKDVIEENPLAGGGR